VLGLPAGRDLTDDDVRAAWRRIAAATHPDRSDGGDPERYAVAAAAYTTLRTRSGRGEAYADLGTAAADRVAGPLSRLGRDRRAGDPVARRHPASGFVRRIHNGRPGVLALRVVAAAAISLEVVVAAGWQPGTVALITGVLTCLIGTGRHDLARPAPPTR
jgi:hypothetical protein